MPILILFIPFSQYVINLIEKPTTITIICISPLLFYLISIHFHYILGYKILQFAKSHLMELSINVTLHLQQSEVDIWVSCYS